MKKTKNQIMNLQLHPKGNDNKLMHLYNNYQKTNEFPITCWFQRLMSCSNLIYVQPYFGSLFGITYLMGLGNGFFINILLFPIKILFEEVKSKEGFQIIIKILILVFFS